MRQPHDPFHDLTAVPSLGDPAEPAAAAAICQEDHDRLLLHRIARGDEGAFAQLVGEHRPRLLRIAARIAPNGRGEDAVQNVLLRAYELLRAGDARPTALAPWLNTMTRNAAIDQRRRTGATAGDGPETAATAGPSADAVAESRAELRRVLGDVAALPADERDALLLRATRGAGHEEIGAYLEVSPGQARQLVHRARRRLREVAAILIPAFLAVRVGQARAAEAAAGGAAAAGGTAATLGAGGGAAAGIGGMKIAALAVSAAVAVGGGAAAVDHVAGGSGRPQAPTAAPQAQTPSSAPAPATAPAGHAQAAQSDARRGDGDGRKAAGAGSSSASPGAASAQHPSASTAVAPAGNADSSHSSGSASHGSGSGGHAGSGETEHGSSSDSSGSGDSSTRGSDGGTETHGGSHSDVSGNSGSGSSGQSSSGGHGKDESSAPEAEQPEEPEASNDDPSGRSSGHSVDGE